MTSVIPLLPIQQPATRLEEERDKMLVAMDRAVTQGNILSTFPTIRQAYWSKDSGEYAEWLAKFPVWEKAIEDTLKMPAADRGRGNSPLIRKGEAEFYPEGERIVLLAQDYSPNDEYDRRTYCDLPENDILFPDEELLSALAQVKQVISHPPSPPKFKFTGRISWSPHILSNYADLLLSLSFSGSLDCTPSHLNHMFGGGDPRPSECTSGHCWEVDIYIWAYPRKFSLSKVSRHKAEFEIMNYRLGMTPMQMYILTPDLTYLEQLARAKVGVIAYDPQRDRVYIPEGSY